MTYRTLTLTYDGGIAVITATADGYAGELTRALDEVALRDDVQALVFVTASSAAGQPEDGDPTLALEQLPQPVIACAEGAVRDEALELLLACDIRIAGAGATFGFSTIAGGRIPAMGGTQRLPRLIGRAKATAMILLGEVIDAESALACGLLSEVTPSGNSETHALKVAQTIAARGPLAVRYAKEAIRQGLDMPLEQALRYETDLTVILQTTDDRAEGVRAFIEKRPPKFEGR